MHIHIIGICGTFMGGLAAIAKEAGHRVTGCDENVYPPMSDQLRALGIELIVGFGADQVALAPDVFVAGNVVKRGNPLMEAILDRGLPYTSGPQWLAETVLHRRWVLGVAGTHGKTTTASLLAWLLEAAGLAPGFLIGGVPGNFPVSARLGAGRHFVIEADEYDTAFFDKRSKFVHYRPRTVVLNNLEFDHADIFRDLDAIETQFHHLVRTVPSSGRIVVEGTQASLARVLARGCWTPVEPIGVPAGWHARALESTAQGEHFDLWRGDARLGRVALPLAGEHNRANAIAAIAAADHLSIPPAASIEALSRFAGVKRRLEDLGTVGGVTVFDDFAHHPTAIRTTIAGLRARIDAEGGGARRILAVIEPRSNTMKLGAMKALLAESLAGADLVWCHSANLGWDPADALAPLGARATSLGSVDALVASVVAAARPGDRVLVMSNGGFGGIHPRLLAALAARAGAVA
ncbi:MAG: UDP-N-acetylmuramate:L-alanyl-gamma-D-glutamyl-meso-diaminopimelate ligase [Lautropia sp.]